MDSIYTIQIPFTGIFTIHQFQDTRTSTLYRQVDMFAHVGNLCNDFQRFVTHILGVRSSETDTHTRRSLSYGTEQHRKSYNFSVRFLKTVRVDILTQQSDFFITFRHQVGHFIKNAFHITATFPSTGIRNNAVGTEIVTSTHNGYKPGNVITANTRRDNIPISLSGRKLYIDCFLARLHSSNQVRKSKISIRTYHQINMMISDQIILYPFGHTSQYSHNQIAFLLFERIEKFQTIENLLLGIVTNGASVHKHCIRFFQRISR